MNKDQINKTPIKVCRLSQKPDKGPNKTKQKTENCRLDFVQAQQNKV